MEIESSKKDMHEPTKDVSFSSVPSLPSGRTFAASWNAPSNIALLKYWGKHGTQLPMNPSLSMTLKNAKSSTSMTVKYSEHQDIVFHFHGEEKPAFAPKIKTFLSRIESFCPWITKASFSINSTNTFPHSAGIASSASSMAALALCIADIDTQLSGDNDQPSFLRKASLLARLASGSASRSVYGGYAVWGHHPAIEDSSDDFAVSFNQDIHPVFKAIHDDILIVDSTPKAVSSSAGHSLMNNHYFREGRIAQANKHLEMLKTALQKGDMDTFIRVTENEAMTLHSLMMSSEESFTLLHPNTLVLIHKIQSFRKQSDIPVCFTLDAGPNIHLLYPEAYAEKIRSFINNRLKAYCEKGSYLQDETGKGPQKRKAL